MNFQEFICHTYGRQRPLSVVYLLQLYTLYVDLIYNQNDINTNRVHY